MKPGMQRDILVAFWLLFDEFEIGSDCDPPDPLEPQATTPPQRPAARPQRPPRSKSDRSA